MSKDRCLIYEYKHLTQHMHAWQWLCPRLLRCEELGHLQRGPRRGHDARKRRVPLHLHSCRLRRLLLRPA